MIVYKNIQLKNPLYNALIFIGKHSMNIFLFHTFIFSHWFRDEIYASRNALIIYFSKSINWTLWNQIIPKNSKVVYKDVIEIKIALEEFEISRGNLSFFIIDATNEIINEVYPQDVLINLKFE